MRFLLLISFILVLNSPVYSQNLNIVGVWKSYQMEAFHKNSTIPDSTILNFTSEIEFFSDSTYQKTTNGILSKGRYRLEENKLYFLKLDPNNEWVHDYMLRWPIGTKDPFPRTPVVDIVYPELLTVKNKKGKEVMDEVDIMYKKIK